MRELPEEVKKLLEQEDVDPLDVKKVEVGDSKALSVADCALAPTHGWDLHEANLTPLWDKTQFDEVQYGDVMGGPGVYVLRKKVSGPAYIAYWYWDEGLVTYFVF